MIVDWESIESAWLKSATDAIVGTAASSPTECFYAGAFSTLYGDYSAILIPGFGLNSENWARDARWHPPDWRWSIIDEAHERLRPLYQPLLALEVDHPTYEALWEQHIDLLARVSHRLTELVRSQAVAVAPGSFSPGFFVGIIDFAQGEDAIDYLKRSVDEATIASSGILDPEQ